MKPDLTCTHLFGRGQLVLFRLMVSDSRFVEGTKLTASIYSSVVGPIKRESILSIQNFSYSFAIGALTPKY